MATGTPTIERPFVATSTQQPAVVIGALPPSDEPAVAISLARPRPSGRMWRQIDRIVGTLGRDAHTDLDLAETRESGTSRQAGQARRVVAPGIVVSEDEYQRRFSAINLAVLRQALSSEAFEVFVRHMGAIEGNEYIDVIEISHGADD